MVEVFIEVLTPAFILVSVIAGLSGVLTGYAGFGGGLIFVPILAYLYSPAEAIGLAVISSLASYLLLLPNAAKVAHWRELTPIIVMSILSVFVGLPFLISADPIFIRRGMGVFITVVALMLMSGWTYRGPRGIPAGCAVGAIAGGVTAGFGIPGGPVCALYFVSAPVEPSVQRANIIIANTSIVIFMVSGLLAAGIYNAPLLTRTAIITPLFLAGTQLGSENPPDHSFEGRIGHKNGP